MSAEEAEEREEVLAEVMDPTYLLGRDVDADGEADADAEGEGVGAFGVGVGVGGEDDKGMDLGLGGEEDVKSELKEVGSGEMVDVMEV